MMAMHLGSTGLQWCRRLIFIMNQIVTSSGHWTGEVHDWNLALKFALQDLDLRLGDDGPIVEVKLHASPISTFQLPAAFLGV